MQVKFTIHSVGRIVGSSSSETCDLVGDEFNPLKEIAYNGVENPYADPSRGTIANATDIPAESPFEITATELL